MVAAASSLSQETLNKLCQSDSYISALALYGLTAEDDEIVDFAIHSLSQTLDFSPISLKNEVDLLIELGLVESIEDFNNRVEKYFDEEEKIIAEEIAEIFW